MKRKEEIAKDIKIWRDTKDTKRDKKIEEKKRRMYIDMIHKQKTN